MNPEIELEQNVKLFEAMPKESYADFILWLCLNFIEDIKYTAEIVGHPLFLTLAEYNDWIESYGLCEHVLDTLVKPLRGKSGGDVVV